MIGEKISSMETHGQPKALQWQVDEKAIGQYASVFALIAEHSEIAHSKIKLAMNQGAVWRLPADSKRAVRVRRKTAKFALGDTIFLYFDAEYLQAQPLTPVLIDDQKDFSVWAKPSGMRVTGSKWGDHLSLIYQIEKQLDGRKTFIVHRLDQWASGLILVAHNKQVTAELAGCFERREVHKTYKALVEAPIEAELPLTIDHKINSKVALSRIIAQRPATAWLNTADANWQSERPDQCSGDEALPSDRNIQEIVIEIETGRKHQIRKHCLQIGRPLLGDRRYRSESASNTSEGRQAIDTECDLQLRSVALGFRWRDQDYAWTLDEAD